MHLVEFALRDFMQVERRASRASVIVLDDIFPNHPLQAQRVRASGVWTGDVWKILPCLRRYRPDLALLALDANPTGLLLVANLDPTTTPCRVLRRDRRHIRSRLRSTGGNTRAQRISRADARIVRDFIRNRR